MDTVYKYRQWNLRVFFIVNVLVVIKFFNFIIIKLWDLTVARIY